MRFRVYCLRKVEGLGLGASDHVDAYQNFEFRIVGEGFRVYQVHRFIVRHESKTRVDQVQDQRLVLRLVHSRLAGSAGLR